MFDCLETMLISYGFYLEPDSLANLVTNMNVAKCANAHDAYLECVNYAVTQLNLANVAMYIDAGIYHIPPRPRINLTKPNRIKLANQLIQDTPVG